MATLRLLPACACAALPFGCRPTYPPPATHAHFDAIQRQEAEIEGARNGALESDSDCNLRCRSTVRGCGAAARVCEIADQVTDADADARCDRAKDRCTAYRNALADCEC